MKKKYKKVIENLKLVTSAINMFRAIKYVFDFLNNLFS